ncbi:MAG: MBOAT family protein [Oscillospiraceae bacterium]|nr:MBOAT family protein [Oscillospiraceae bacterium]
MLFSSSIFLFAFLPAVLLIYYGLLRKRVAGQNVFLLLASLFFYWWGEPKFFFLMLLSILMNYGFGLWAAAARNGGGSVKLPVACAAAANLSVLFVFKYLNFTVNNLMLLGFELAVPDIALPIGISFFTFQAMSYVFDIARGRGEAQKNPLNVGLYIAFFPQLVAGPIVRYEIFAGQISSREETWSRFAEGTRRLSIGFCKKILLANQLAVIADAAFSAQAPAAAFAWLGAVSYSLQIYYDFSGYSDMAIGLGKMLGFEFSENFMWPYASKSVSEFWRRWHISLSGWFRDYVYFPMGGSRVDRRWKHIRNLCMVWLLTGLWHGAAWTFICWGMFYLAIILLEKNLYLGKRWSAPLQRGYTLLAVILAWTLFRAEDIGAAGRYLLALFGANGGFESAALFYIRENWPVLLAGILFAVPSAAWLRDKLSSRRYFTVFQTLSSVLLLTALVAAGTYLVKGTYNPFIYFNF